MAHPRFVRALEQLYSEDLDEREKGWDFIREHADSFAAELIAEFESRDEDDHEFRPLLLELICEARSPRALPLLAAQLDSDDESLRLWGERGLEMLGTREAEDELRRARLDGRLG